MLQVKKRIKKLPQEKLILPTPIILLFSEISNLTSDTKFNRGNKSEFNKTLKSGWARFKRFPGASPKDVALY